MSGCSHRAVTMGKLSLTFVTIIAIQFVAIWGCTPTGTPDELTTDFEMYNYKWKSRGTLQWTRYSGRTPSRNTGPGRDHTSMTENGPIIGSYVYVEASSPAKEGDQAWLEANTTSSSDSCVMNFYYHMFGLTMGKLEVKINGNVVFSQSRHYRHGWKLGSVPIAKGNAAIQFIATRGRSWKSDIAIDDITFSKGCTPTPVVSGQLTTDFETDNGKWKSQGSLEWTRQSGSTGSSGTGPSADHTTGSGWYVYMESSGKHEGDQAKFEGDTLSMSDSCVMNFYYHMYGSQMGRLEVTLNGKVVFSKSGDQGNQWTPGSVTIAKGNAEIQFFATRGNGDKSNIAIDDVRFTPECTATPGQLTTDFETDNGKWILRGTLRWKRQSGSTESRGTGPSADHTSGSGTYIYMNTGISCPGDQGLLEAATQSASDSCSMNFYYNMNGPTMGKLEVKLNREVVYSVSGDQRDQWKQGSVTIAKGDAIIQFVATRGPAWQSNIAIDDITFSSNCK
ncbi:MAM and LDL-receptor class A domain-containing protein 1-like [Tubulanus polymorphus]|uniref:MAM and LDL-receptor class A domain-containing protein 1-like n=1 Tax=Tubulanus polymorphus TaxID=672921 RepID=UPI003DA3A8B4